MRQVEVPEPPRPPPPPRTRDVLECNGCGFQVDGPTDGACWTLPDGWFRGHVTDGSSGAVRRADTIDLCPGCREGATIVIPPRGEGREGFTETVKIP